MARDEILLTVVPVALVVFGQTLSLSQYPDESVTVHNMGYRQWLGPDANAADASLGRILGARSTLPGCSADAL